MLQDANVFIFSEKNTMVNQKSIVIWSNLVRGNVVCPAPGQDDGAFEVVTVLAKFTRLATSRSHLFSIVWQHFLHV